MESSTWFVIVVISTNVLPFYFIGNNKNFIARKELMIWLGWSLIAEVINIVLSEQGIYNMWNINIYNLVELILCVKIFLDRLDFQLKNNVYLFSFTVGIILLLIVGVNSMKYSAYVQILLMIVMLTLYVSCFKHILNSKIDIFVFHGFDIKSYVSLLIIHGVLMRSLMKYEVKGEVIWMVVNDVGDEYVYL